MFGRLEEDLEDESESEAAAASDRVAFDGMENESDDETMENSSKEGKAEKIVSNGVPSEPRAVNSALSDTDHPSPLLATLAKELANNWRILRGIIFKNHQSASITNRVRKKSFLASLK